MVQPDPSTGSALRSSYLGGPSPNNSNRLHWQVPVHWAQNPVYVLSSWPCMSGDVVPLTFPLRTMPGPPGPARPDPSHGSYLLPLPISTRPDLFRPGVQQA